MVLPADERVFNPSRETRLILRQAKEIGEHASRLCELMFAAEGRVGQRKLWGIVGLTKRYPAVCIDGACAQALAQDWGAQWLDLGLAGHINADSALGAWPQGHALLQTLMKE